MFLLQCDTDSVLSQETTNTIHSEVYILSLHCTYMFRYQLTIFRVLVVTEYINSICAYVQDIMIHKCVKHIQHIMCRLKIKS